MPLKEEQNNWVAIAGGANVDIGGKSNQALIERDSNPGRVQLSAGGVARNIAHNLALLDVPVRLFSVIGDDVQGKLLLNTAKELHMEQELVVTRQASTSTYLYVADPDGDMRVAISDMEICRLMTPDFFAERIAKINAASVLVADANLMEESLTFLGDHVSVPLFVDPVSVAKSKRITGILSKIHTLKPNRYEAEYLSGIRITNQKEALQAARKLLDTGVQRVFISLGEQGVLAADHTKQMVLAPLPAKAVGMTGAGDAFMAGLVYAYGKGASLQESAEIALAVSACTMESEQTINPQLSPAMIEEKRRAATQ